VQHHTREFGLHELVRLAASGSLALPEFQREFVWEPNRVVELLDSVANGWPIGSLLVLEGPQPFEIKKLDHGPEVMRETTRYYLLDGQQRVTSLFHALTDTSDYIYYVDLADTDVDDDGLPRVRWAARRRGIPKARQETAITIAELARDESFHDRLAMQSTSAAAHARTVRKARVGSLGGKYLIPATVMSREIELEALTRIFETLNRTGVRLNAFDLMVAVLYPVGFNLREEWERAEDLNPTFKHLEVDGLELLKLVALWRRGEDRQDASIPTSRRVQGVRQRDVLRVPPEYVKDRWPSAVEAYGSALEFIGAEAGVRDPESVPSDAMVLTLAYLLNAGLSRDEASRWWWSAIADQRYLQGANTQVLTDIDSAREPHLNLGTAVADVASSALEPVRRNRILRLGLRGLLVRRGARDPFTGEMLDGPVTDVALPDLIEGDFKFGSDRPVVDLVVFNAQSVDEIKERLRRDGRIPLRDDALQSQAINSVTDIAVRWRTERGLALAGWMESMR
jgi:hypothetical protein